MLIIFDFDGTLVDSQELILKLANKYHTQFKTKTITKKELKENGTRGLFYKIKLPFLKKLYYLIKIRIEFKQRLNELKLFPNTKELLLKLQKNHKIAIISANKKSTIQKYFNNINKNSKAKIHFDFIKATKISQSKTNILKKIKQKYNEKIIYIGDEITDITSCKSNQIPIIAVTYGIATKNQLKKLNPNFLIDNINEINSIIKNN
jgi:HAD superfamily hydrolase (TIGR01549 family)